MRKFILYSFALFPFAIAQSQIVKIAVEKGQKYKVEDSTRMTSSSSMGGETFESLLETNSTSIYQVTELSKKEIELRSTLTRLISHTKVMDRESTYDSDKKENDAPLSDAFSKRIGKSKKMLLDLHGNIIKEDEPEKAEDPVTDMSWLNSSIATPLFMPQLIGKEFKAGDSIPFAISFSKEKPSASFSFNKESMTTSDTGVFMIHSVRDGIATISYTGNRVLTMVMKIGDQPVTNIMNSTVRADMSIDMNTGIVISSILTEEAMTKAGAGDPASPLTMKTTVTTKITLLE